MSLQESTWYLQGLVFKIVKYFQKACVYKMMFCWGVLAIASWVLNCLILWRSWCLQHVHRVVATHFPTAWANHLVPAKFIFLSPCIFPPLPQQSHSPRTSQCLDLLPWKLLTSKAGLCSWTRMEKSVSKPVWGWRPLASSSHVRVWEDQELSTFRPQISHSAFHCNWSIQAELSLVEVMSLLPWHFSSLAHGEGKCEGHQSPERP